jgi:hypothetical protein
MTTECSADLFGFTRVEGHEVVASFDGGAITSDAGALLLGAVPACSRTTDRLPSQPTRKSTSMSWASRADRVLPATGPVSDRQ